MEEMCEWVYFMHIAQLFMWGHIRETCKYIHLNKHEIRSIATYLDNNVLLVHYLECTINAVVIAVTGG